MFEKNLTIGYLLDFYGELLGDRRRELMSLYYNEDYSLAEIADETGFTDYKLFLKFFRYHAGCTPSEFRKVYYAGHTNNR